MTEENKKPPRSSLPKGWAPDEMDLEKALTLLSLPREVGQHPEDGETDRGRDRPLRPLS